MEKKDATGIVPGQYTGKAIDAESSIELGTVEEARTFYHTVKNRLLDVNHWHELAGKLLAVFQLTDATGQPVERPVQKGDYFRIDVPGPGSKSGEGYDWVQVESLEEVNTGTVECIGIRVRPAPNPQTNTEAVAHFYDAASTSNFTVTHEGKTITAAIYDRNTKPNEDAENVTDRIRNSAVGAGAMTIFSKVQWKSLAEGLLKRINSVEK